MEAGVIFPYPPGKNAHKPTQAGQRGDLALSAVNLQDFFGIHSSSPFLCLCGAVFAQGNLPIEYSNNVL